jgi:hypothetical protein
MSAYRNRGISKLAYGCLSKTYNRVVGHSGSTSLSAHQVGRRSGPCWTLNSTYLLLKVSMCDSHSWSLRGVYPFGVRTGLTVTVSGKAPAFNRGNNAYPENDHPELRFF